MGQRPQLPSRGELLVELIGASEEIVRLTKERVELYGRIEADTRIVIDLSIRINQLADNVENLNAVVESLNNRIDEIRQRHQSQINSLQSINHQAIIRLEQEKLSLLNQTNTVLVALVAAQQIIIQFYDGGINAANAATAADDGATADAEDATVGGAVD